MAAPLGESSENSQLLEKLLYESNKGRSTEPVASSTGLPGIVSVEFQKTLRKKEIPVPTPEVSKRFALACLYQNFQFLTLVLSKLVIFTRIHKVSYCIHTAKTSLV